MTTTTTDSHKKKNDDDPPKRLLKEAKKPHAAAALATYRPCQMKSTQLLPSFFINTTQIHGWWGGHRPDTDYLDRGYCFFNFVARIKLSVANLHTSEIMMVSRTTEYRRKMAELITNTHNTHTHTQKSKWWFLRRRVRRAVDGSSAFDEKKKWLCIADSSKCTRCGAKLKLMSIKKISLLWMVLKSTKLLFKGGNHKPFKIFYFDVNCWKYT